MSSSAAASASASVSSSQAPSGLPSGGDEAPRSHRRSRRRRKARRAPRARSVDGLKAWAEVLDGLLVAVEETAWAVRDLAGSVDGLLERGGREVRGAKGEVGLVAADLTRSAETGFMLARLAAGYRLHGVKSAFVSRKRADEMLEELHRGSARRFYEASAAHGGAFMKVGQMLSARQDLLPEIWIRELEQLQDAAPPIEAEVAVAVVEAELGRPVGELFAAFDVEPLAAASIGQVHHAVLRDGREVAVKVQRPGIERRVRVDLDLLELFLDSLAASLPETDYETIVSEVRSAVLSEVEYVAEAEACRTVAAHFAGHPGIVIPAPVPEACSEHVLTTEYLPGEKLTVALDRLEARRDAGDADAQAELSRALGLLLEAYLRQVLEVGVFQADPHPGNLRLASDGRIGILDFGCAGRLEPAVKERYLGLVCAFVTGDEARMAELFGELGFRTRSGRPDTLNTFAHALLGEIRQAISGGGVKWPTKEELEARLVALLGACHDDPVVVLPREFILIARVFMTLGGLFARYRPDLDVSVHVLPVLGPALIGAVLGMA